MIVDKINLTTHIYGVVVAVLATLPKQGYSVELTAGDKMATIYTPTKPERLDAFVRQRLYLFNEIIPLQDYDKRPISKKNSRKHRHSHR
jgi:hypothetical protein